MDIEKINRKHFVETDMFYRMDLGISSKLLKVSNGVFYLEIILSNKWSGSYTRTATEIAHLWKMRHNELEEMIAAKLYFIDEKKNPYKRDLIVQGIKPDYDAKKGIIFKKYYLN